MSTKYGIKIGTSCALIFDEMHNLQKLNLKLDVSSKVLYFFFGVQKFSQQTKVKLGMNQFSASIGFSIFILLVMLNSWSCNQIFYWELWVMNLNFI
jgi:hypothetical protein